MTLLPVFRIVRGEHACVYMYVLVYVRVETSRKISILITSPFGLYWHVCLTQGSGIETVRPVFVRLIFFTNDCHSPKINSYDNKNACNHIPFSPVSLVVDAPKTVNDARTIIGNQLTLTRGQ